MLIRNMNIEMYEKFLTFTRKAVAYRCGVAAAATDITSREMIMIRFGFPSRYLANSP